MKKSKLLPHFWQNVGYISLAVPVVLIYILLLTHYNTPAWLDYTMSIAIFLSFFLIVFSQEKHETENTDKARLWAVAWTFVISMAWYVIKYVFNHVLDLEEHISMASYDVVLYTILLKIKNRK